MRDATYWFEVMTPGVSLLFLHRDGAELKISGPAGGTYSVRYTDARGHVMREAAVLDSQTVLRAIARYLGGDVTGFI